MRGGVDMQVLVVDDDPDVRQMLGITVRAAGYRPTLAGTASEAYALCAAFRPDVMLLDMSMPDGGGADLLRQLSSDGIAPAATVFVSAQPPRELADAAGHAGVDFLAKPVRPDEVRTVLHGIAGFVVGDRDPVG